MPGLLGTIGADAAWMDREAPFADRARLAGRLRGADLDVRVLARDSRTGGHAQLGDVELGFEGHLLGDAREGREVAAALLQRYAARGPDFVAELDGSFQIAIRDGRRLHLCSDALGSRRPFFVHRGTSFAFAPRVSLLRALVPSAPLDHANLTQFLLFGRFFAGECALEPIRQLLPGEIATVDDGKLSRRRWFRYEVASEPAGRAPFDEADALAQLAARVDRAILAAWQHMRAPAILLSGGYDSRYLLNVLREHVPDLRALRSVLWGVQLDRPGSDGAAAAELARRAGLEHLEIERDLEALADHVDELLEAQSGMTELAFGHADELAICRTYADRHGIGALLRGDEVFGPTGAGPSDLADARARSCARAVTAEDGLARWFVDDAAPYARAHAARVEELVRECPPDALGLRDTLYGRERLPAFTHQLTAHKLPALEVYNPLQAVDVVRFYSALPAWCRDDKALFKRSYHQRFTDTRDVPIATGGNGLEWGSFIPRAPAIQARLRRDLAALPPPLSASFFLEQLELASRAAPPPRAPGSAPSPAQLVMRAAVLAWWLR
jgi:Asparagine synthase